MKKFNINDYIYIQITPEGWSYLKKTVGKDYLKDTERKEINGETWHRLQAHEVFRLLSTDDEIFLNANVLIEDQYLKSTSTEFVTRRKKVEAKKFTRESFEKIVNFTDGRARNLEGSPFAKVTCVIDSYRGENIAVEGDWIIKNEDGDFYPCNPDAFADTYAAF